MGFFRRLFQRKGDTSPETTELPGEVLDTSVAPPEEAFEDTLEAPSPAQPATPFEEQVTIPTPKPRAKSIPPHALQVGYASHIGKVRQRNEDSLLVITSATQGDASLPPFGLFVVADGMGGHSEGQKASQLTVRTVGREVMTQIFPPFLQLDNSEPPRPVQDILSKAVLDANWIINGINKESGTTCTAILVLGNRLFAAHVGDSRAYLIQDVHQPAVQISTDHSFVQRLQDAGQITAEEAAVHPQRNILYRAVGQGDKLDIDTFSRQLSGPSWIVICSDGLWGLVPNDTLQKTITSADSPQQACEELVDEALKAGGPDNITVIIVQYDPAGSG